MIHVIYTHVSYNVCFTCTDGLPAAVVVFNLSQPGNIAKAMKGERVGTLIGGQEILQSL